MRHGKYPFIIGFLTAPLLVYVVYVISPYLQAFYISLTDWRGFSSRQQFVGVDNYLALIEDEVFGKALWHNILLLLFLPLITILLGLFFAFMLNVGGRGRRGSIQGVRGSGFYKVVYFFPQVLSVAIIALLWQFVYHPTNGILNGILTLPGKLGLPTVEPLWLGDPNLVLWAILAVLIWHGVGFYMVLFSAGMQSIPKDIYEAALLDGANRFHTFFRVTVPLLWDSIQVAWVYLAIIALDAFALVQIMTPQQGGPDHASEVIGTLLYRNAFEYSKFGYATAMGVALFFITLTIAALSLRVTRRERIEF